MGRTRKGNSKVKDAGKGKASKADKNKKSSPKSTKHNAKGGKAGDKHVTLGPPPPKKKEEESASEKAPLAVQISVDAAGKITDVVFGGRTESPFGSTMGAHSVAWIAHTDAVKRRVLGLTPAEAADQIKALYDEAALLGALTLKGHVASSHQTKLEAKSNKTKAFDGRAKASNVHDLQHYISAYLEFVNFIPAATVESGDKRGHGEGTARGRLIQFELTGVYTPKRAKDGSVTTIEMDLWTLFAHDTPEKFAGDINKLDMKSDIWIHTVEMFLLVTRDAYPRSLKEIKFTGELTLTAKLALFGLSSTEVTAVIDALKAKKTKPLTPIKNLPSTLPANTQQSMAAQLVFEGGTLKTVKTAGRTKSPFKGTMGAHSTAWVAHLDAINKKLAGKTLVEVKELLDSELDDYALNLEAMKVVRYIRVEHLYSIYNARELAFQRQTATAGILDGSVTDVDQQVSLLQHYFNAYMEFFNTIPLMTAQEGDTGGHAEGIARGKIKDHENGTAPLGQQALAEQIITLFAPDAPATFGAWLAQVIEGMPAGYDGFKGVGKNAMDTEFTTWRSEFPTSKTHNERELWRAFIEEYSPIGDMKNIHDHPAEWVWAASLDVFIDTLSEAYPGPFKDAGFGTGENPNIDAIIDAVLASEVRNNNDGHFPGATRAVVKRILVEIRAP